MFVQERSRRYRLASTEQTLSSVPPSRWSLRGDGTRSAVHFLSPGSRPPKHEFQLLCFAGIQADDIYGSAVLPIIRHIPNDLYHTEAMKDKNAIVHCTRCASWPFAYPDVCVPHVWSNYERTLSDDLGQRIHLKQQIRVARRARSVIS